MLYRNAILDKYKIQEVCITTQLICKILVYKYLQIQNDLKKYFLDSIR